MNHSNSSNWRYLIPNGITALCATSGFSAILLAQQGQFVWALYAIVLAMVLDTLDGMVARLLHATSDMGKQLDSLSDMISFGVAPAAILYAWQVNEMGWIGRAALSFYMISVMFRLARFNLAPKRPDWQATFFTGVPSPAGAGLVLLPMVIVLSGLAELHNESFVVLVTLLVVPFLMVSHLPTYSIRVLSPIRNTTLGTALILTIYLVFLLAAPFKTLFITGLIYLCLLPAGIWHFKKLKRS